MNRLIISTLDEALSREAKSKPLPEIVRRALVHMGHAQERLITVEKAITEVKEKMIDDLGLDPAKPWGYYGDVRLKEECKTEDKMDNGNG